MPSAGPIPGCPICPLLKSAPSRAVQCDLAKDADRPVSQPRDAAYYLSNLDVLPPISLGLC